MAGMSAHAEAQRSQEWRPEVGTRVLAFHPVARAWRPATVASVVQGGEVRVFFVGYAIDEGSGQAGGPSEYVVKIPEELEPLEAAGDFLAEAGESERGKAWRGILLSLAVADPRVYGERRAAANMDAESLASADVYALLVAAMLDADARIAGGAALYVRMRRALADYDPARMVRLGEEEIARARAVMPSPLRARVLVSNARRFLEIEGGAGGAGGGGFRAWLKQQADPVGALGQTFDRLEPRAAVLFLRYLGIEAIAPDEALTRVGQRLGWVRRHPRPSAADVRDAWTETARVVGDRVSLMDLTVRRFADGVCQVEPLCDRCAVAVCPSRRVDSNLVLPG
jgi:endonuclease III